MASAATESLSIQHVRVWAGLTAGGNDNGRVGSVGPGSRRARHLCECFRVVSGGGGGGMKRYGGRSVLSQLARRRTTTWRCSNVAGQQVANYP